MSIWERAARLDARYIYILLVIVLALPLLKPWNLPIPVSPETVAFYEVLKALPKDHVVGIAADYRSDTLTELDPIIKAIARQLMTQGNRIVIWALIDEGANVSQAAVAPIAEELGRTYGVDWINLGYKPGTQVTLQKMIDNLDEGAGYTDFLGKTLRDYPIMQGIDSLADMDLVICIPSTMLGTQPYLTMLTIPHNIPFMIGCTSGGAPDAVNMFKAGQYKGAVAGLRGAAEYEKLLGSPGIACAGMDAQSGAHILMIALIVCANVIYFNNKKAKTGGAR